MHALCGNGRQAVLATSTTKTVLRNYLHALSTMVYLGNQGKKSLRRSSSCLPLRSGVQLCEEPGLAQLLGFTVLFSAVLSVRVFSVVPVVTVYDPTCGLKGLSEMAIVTHRDGCSSTSNSLWEPISSCQQLVLCGRIGRASSLGSLVLTNFVNHRNCWGHKWHRTGRSFLAQWDIVTRETCALLSGVIWELKIHSITKWPVQSWLK